ncbi:MAG: CopG family transcriptional regulator [Desulfurococcaceae archaeon]
MSSVVSFKVPIDLKKRMEKLKNYVNWNEELRKYLIKRLEELERELNMKEVVELLKKTSSVPSGTAMASVREDRDSY